MSTEKLDEDQKHVPFEGKQKDELFKIEPETTGRVLDLSDKNNWTTDNAKKIAEILGFEMDDEFAKALKIFIKEVVEKATVTAFLQIMATRSFVCLCHKKAKSNYFLNH